jgi:hypothetical protein
LTTMIPTNARQSASVQTLNQFYKDTGANYLNNTCYEVYFSSTQGKTPVDWDNRMDDDGLSTVTWDVNIYAKRLTECAWTKNTDQKVPETVDTMNLCVNLFVWQSEAGPYDDNDLSLAKAGKQQGEYSLGLSASGKHVKQHIHNNEAYHNQGGVCVLFDNMDRNVSSYATWDVGTAPTPTIVSNVETPANDPSRERHPVYLTSVTFTATVRGNWTALSLEPWQGVTEKYSFVDHDPDRFDPSNNAPEFNTNPKWLYNHSQQFFRPMTRLSNGESSGRTFYARTVPCWQNSEPDNFVGNSDQDDFLENNDQLTNLYCDYSVDALPKENSRSAISSTYYTLPAAGFADTRPEAEGCVAATGDVLDAMTPYEKATIRLQPIGACCIPLVVEAIFASGDDSIKQLYYEGPHNVKDFTPSLNISIIEYYKIIKTYADQYAYCDVVDHGTLNIKDALYLLSLVAQSELPTSFASQLNNYKELSSDDLPGMVKIPVSY